MQRTLHRAAMPALLASLALAGLLSGQTPLRAQMTGTEERAALTRARADAIAARKRAEAFEDAATRAGKTADRTRANAAALGARIQQGEAEIILAKGRIAEIERMRAQHRRALAERQEPIAGLVAALQAMARQPAALALVSPGSINDKVHMRLLLATVLPDLQARTSALRAELDRGRQLRARAGQALAALQAGRAALDRDRLALARLEARQRETMNRFDHLAMLQQERAQGLSEQAHDLVGLMARIETDAATAARLALLPGPVPHPDARDAPSPRPSAVQPAIRRPPLSGAPRYRLPVMGMVVEGMGERAPSGLRAQGITLATAPGALVVAPSGGAIRFSGPFRDYGKIVIIDHGRGWTTLVTGLGQSTSPVGTSVVQGSPIGRAPAGRARITVELRRNGRPVDIARLAVRP